MNYLTYFTPIGPEVFVTVMACAVLLVSVFLDKKYPNIVYGMTQFTILGAILLTWPLYGNAPMLAFSGHFIVDNVAIVLKMAIYIISFLVFLYARDNVKTIDMPVGEYYVLSLFSILGMMTLVSAHSLLAVYLSLELLSLPLYALVTLRRDDLQAPEAGIKFFIMGALASGMLLYGISLIYGATGTLGLAEIAHTTMQVIDGKQLWLGMGLVFLVAGFAFKLGAVPFHMWLPDVYQGSASNVTLFLASAPKLAAFGMVVRLLWDGLGGLYAQWQPLVLILAVLSLVIGNVVALAQTQIKRLFAYSTIAHIGFILLAISVNSFPAALFYVLVYVLMAAASFAILMLLQKQGVEVDLISDLRGLYRQHPWYAFIILVIMFSLAGVPPTIGFYAKLIVLEELVKAGFVNFAILGVVFSVIGAFYYLKVIKTIYFDNADDALPFSNQHVSSSFTWVWSANGLALLALGLFPGPLLALCYSVFK